MICHALLLDDEPNVLVALRRELMRKPDIGHDGLEIDSFTLPSEALEYISCPVGAIDLAIVDFRMPGMDGIRFLKELKRLQPDAVRILLTGDADCAIAIESINEASVDNLVFKPWHEYDLKGRIALALHQRALVRQNRERREQVPLSGRPRQDPYRLLLVDDEPSILHALKREIDGGTGALPVFVTRSYTSAESALRAAAVECPDLVIADYAMPGMDGVTFFHHLRELCPNAVRIMLSGRADVTVLSDAINIAGIYHFLRKPWATVELRATIAQALVYHDILIENDVGVGSTTGTAT